MTGDLRNLAAQLRSLSDRAEEFGVRVKDYVTDTENEPGEIADGIQYVASRCKTEQEKQIFAETFYAFTGVPLGDFLQGFSDD